MYNSFLLFLSIKCPYSNLCWNRLAYPLYVIDELLRRCEDKNIHLRVVYDIACVVASHLHVSTFLCKTELLFWEKTLTHLLKIMLYCVQSEIRRGHTTQHLLGHTSISCLWTQTALPGNYWLYRDIRTCVTHHSLPVCPQFSCL